MIVAVDTHYEERRAFTAGVLFVSWTDSSPVRTVNSASAAASDYQPGELYRRELPAILGLLEHVPEDIDLIVVDGYVWLDGDGRPGLGAHLFEALGRRTPVVGVAKNAFKGAEHAQAVYRGTSTRPLYVTAAGCDPVAIAKSVKLMHGASRIPTLLKLADQLSRAPQPR